MKGKYLITTDNYFVAPDGKLYRAAWGEVKVMSTKEALGFDPNRNSANWMVQVGSDTNHVLLAGCQIHYSVSCPDRPNTDQTRQIYEKGEIELRDNPIYIPDDVKQDKSDGSLDKDQIAWERDMHKLLDVVEENTQIFRSAQEWTDTKVDIRQGKIRGFKFYRPAYQREKMLILLLHDGREITYEI